jgi:hypothetical protein
MQQNFSTNVGKTQQNLLRHLLYADAYAWSTNWLVKLTPRVNFTNILQAAFCKKKFFSAAFYVLTIWVCNFLAKGFWRISCS